MSFKKNIAILLLLFFTQMVSAQSKTDSIKQLISKEKNDSIKVNLLIQLAIQYKRKKTDSTLYYATESLHLAMKTEYDLGIAESYNQLAWANYTRRKFKEADTLAQNAIKFYTISNAHNYKIGNCYRLLSSIKIEDKKQDKAFKYLFKAKEMYDSGVLIRGSSSFENNEVKAVILNDIAYLFLEVDNYLMAMKYLNEAMPYAKSNDQTSSLADSYNILGAVYAEQENFTKAVEYYEMSKAIYIKNNDGFSTTACNINIGIAYYENNQYNEAIGSLEEASEKAISIQYKAGELNSYVYLGKSYIELNRFTKAGDYLEKAEKIAIEYNIPTSEIIIAKSDVYKRKKNYSKAIKTLESHLNQAKVNLFPKEKIKIYTSLADTYEKNKEYHKALISQKKQYQIQDSIIDVRKVIQTGALQAEFEYKKVKNDLKNKEEELKNRENELVISEEKTHSLRLIYGLFIIAGGSLFIISTLIYLRKKEIWKNKQELQVVKQQHSEDELKFKNKQITDFALNISEKNDLLLNIKKRISSLTNADKSKNTKLSDLILYLNSTLEQNSEKVAIYSAANNTKDAFYHNLRELYPDLTEKEKRVAAFIHLNLSSKQIAIQLNITRASVDNYRYSLRKKMNMSREISLHDFIKKI